MEGIWIRLDTGEMILIYNEICENGFKRLARIYASIYLTA